MSLLVGCPGPGGFLSGGVFVWGGLFPRGSFARGHFLPGGLLDGAFFSGGAFVRGGDTFVRGAYVRSPKFNAYTNRVGFLCLPS